MQEDEIKQLMTEWGIRPIPGEAYEHNVLGFARAIEAKEREACAKACAQLSHIGSDNQLWMRDRCVAVILARSNAGVTGAELAKRPR